MSTPSQLNSVSAPKPHGCTIEAKSLSQPVFEVTSVGEMQQLRSIDEQGKDRRLHTQLIYVKDLQWFALVTRGLI